MIIAMTQTVGEYTNANTYHVRARTGEKLIAASQATKSLLKPVKAGVLPAKTGKSDK